jgi:hypothetical protein
VSPQHRDAKEGGRWRSGRQEEVVCNGTVDHLLRGAPAGERIFLVKRDLKSYFFNIASSLDWVLHEIPGTPCPSSQSHSGVTSV